MQAKNSFSSWLQLALFTAFLFLLVAIPYTIFLKVSTPKGSPTIASLPIVNAKPTTVPQITPPAPSTNTICLPVADTYQLTSATPAAYLFQNKTKEVCYVPALPPFPFIWKPYHNSQFGYTIDTPNWTDKSTTTGGQTVHIFMPEDTSATASAIAFAWYEGQDPLASTSGYITQKVQIDHNDGVVYTKANNSISAVFQTQKGYFSLTAAINDSSLYAFQHMLESLKFTK